MALYTVVNKVESAGSYKIYGKRSLSIGEVVLLILAIVLMAKKGGVNLANRWVLAALALIVIAFVVW